MRNIVKLLLLLTILVPSTTSYGQTTKGSFFISGSTRLQLGSNNVRMTYDGNTQNEYDETSFSLMPSAGYFVIDNLAIGLSSNISHNKTTLKDGSEFTNNSRLIAPTATYYLPLTGQVRPYAELGFGYLLVTSKSELASKAYNSPEVDRKNSADGFAINFGGGISYFATKNIAINLGLSLTKSTLTDSDDDKYKIKQNSFGSSIGISLFF